MTDREIEMAKMTIEKCPSCGKSGVFTDTCTNCGDFPLREPLFPKMAEELSRYETEAFEKASMVQRRVCGNSGGT